MTFSEILGNSLKFLGLQCTHLHTDMHTDIQTDRHTHTLIARQTYRHTDIHTDIQTDIQAYRQTDRQTDRHSQTRQTDIETDTNRQTDRQTEKKRPRIFPPGEFITKDRFYIASVYAQHQEVSTHKQTQQNQHCPIAEFKKLTCTNQYSLMQDALFLFDCNSICVHRQGF